MTNAAYNRLLDCNIKPSVQRIAIMQHLIDSKSHPGVDEVYNALKDNMPTLSKTTVYNTLKLFIENGAAVCLNIDEKNARFDGDLTKHMHFRCNKCGKILDVQISQPIDDLWAALPGFKVTGLQLYQTGLCNECNNTN